MGQVFAGLSVVNDKVSLGTDPFRQVLELHIRACVGIVEPAVGVFLDDDRPALVFGIPCHVSIAPTPWGRPSYPATAKSVARSLCRAPGLFAKPLTARNPRLPCRDSLSYDTEPPRSGDAKNERGRYCH